MKFVQILKLFVFRFKLYMCFVRMGGANQQVLIKRVMRFMVYIYEYITTYLPTFSVNPTRESKDQIGMALASFPGSPR